MKVNRWREPGIKSCLVAVLVACLGIGFMPIATAAPVPAPFPLIGLVAQRSEFPDAIAVMLRQDLSHRVSRSPAQLTLIAATAQQWSDGCLELAQSGEFCTQAIVSGWRVVLSDGKQRWVYHTDATGQVYRLAGSN